MNFQLSILAALALAFASFSVQEKRSFDPARDLPGFEQARASEYKELYQLDAFAELFGNELSAAELEQVRARWKAEQERMNLRIAELGKDPELAFRTWLDLRLSKHEYFSKLALARDESVPRFTFLVQKPAQDDGTYVAKQVQEYRGALELLRERFDKLVAKPLGLVPRGDAPRTAIAILVSPGDFQNYYGFSQTDFGGLPTAIFDKRLQVVVACADPFSKTAPAVRQEALKHECVRALLEAHRGAAVPRIKQQWVHAGVGGYLSAAPAKAPEASEVSMRDLVRLVACARAADQRESLLSLTELARIVTWSELFDTTGKVTSEDYQKGMALFRAQSALYVHYLMEGESGRNRPAFERYLKSALAGLGGTDALELALAGSAPAALDQGFWRWVYDEHERRDTAKQQLDRAGIDALLRIFTERARSADDGAETSETEAKPDLKPVPEPPFDPTVLALDTLDVESWHALGLERARLGDLEGARAVLDKLALQSLAPPIDQRVARDTKRIAAALALRDGYLEALRARGGRLTIEHAGRKIAAPVAKVENGLVVFGESKSGIASVPLAEIEPVEIAKLATKREEQGSAPAWTRAWIHLLAGEPKWEKLLKEDSAEARALREDAAVWYPEQLRIARAARVIDELSRSALPDSRAAGEARLVVLGELLHAFGDTALVVAKKDTLRKYAEKTALRVANDFAPNELIQGKFSRASDGTVSLSYDFERAEEGLDFQQQKGFMKELHAKLPKLEQTEDQARADVRKSALALSGQSYWRHRLPFRAPFKVHVTFRLEDESDELMTPVYVDFLACEEGAWRFIRFGGLNGLGVTDDQAGISKWLPDEGKSIEFKLAYDVEFVNDGKKAAVTDAGTKRGEIPVGPRTSGAFGIFLHTPLTVYITQLEFVGKLMPEGLDVLRKAWVKTKLVELGF